MPSVPCAAASVTLPAFGRLRRFPRPCSAQHAPLDLGAGRPLLLLADQPAGAVAFKLAELIAVNGEVVVGSRRAPAVPAQHGDQHRRDGKRRQQSGGKREDHRLPGYESSSSSASSRRRSSAERGVAPAPRAPALARRNRAKAMAAPATKTAAGPNQSA